MSDTTSPWDTLRRLRDELKLEIHLAGMEARDKWQELQPRIEKLQEKVLAASDRAEHYVDEEMTAVGKALRELRDNLKSK
jgi:adenine-specific DNA methylase